MKSWTAGRAAGAGSAVVGLVGLMLLLRCIGLGELGAALQHAHPSLLIAYFGISCAVRGGYSLRWYAAAAAFGPRPTIGRFVLARLAGDAVGVLFPTLRVAGDPVRIALVSADLPAARAGAGVAIDRVMELIGNMGFVVIAVTMFSLARGTAHSLQATEITLAATALLLGMLSVPLILLRRGQRPLWPLHRWVAPRAPHAIRRVLRVLRDTEDHLIRFFRRHPVAFLLGVLSSLAIEALIVAEYHFLLSAFGIVLDVPTLLLALLGSGVARVVPTPAGLGALEASEVAVLTAVGGQPGVGLAVGLVMRLHESVWMAVGFGALSLRGMSLGRVRLLASRDQPA